MNQSGIKVQLAIAVVLLNQEAEEAGEYATFLVQAAELITFIVANNLEHTDWRKLLKDVIPTDAYVEVEKILFYEAVEYARPMWEVRPVYEPAYEDEQPY